MSKTTYLIFAILFSALSIIYPAIILVQHPHRYVICTYLYTALTVTSGALCWLGHAFKSNPQRTNKEHLEKCLDEIDRLKTAHAEQKAEIERLTEERDGYLDDRFAVCHKLREMTAKNEELKKQVDELKEELEKAYEIERANIQAEIADAGTSCHWCRNVTVKDTAKEIECQIRELFYIPFEGKTEKQKYQRKGMEEGLEMALSIVKGYTGVKVE